MGAIFAAIAEFFETPAGLLSLGWLFGSGDSNDTSSDIGINMKFLGIVKLGLLALVGFLIFKFIKKHK